MPATPPALTVSERWQLLRASPTHWNGSSPSPGKRRFQPTVRPTVWPSSVLHWFSRRKPSPPRQLRRDPAVSLAYQRRAVLHEDHSATTADRATQEKARSHMAADFIVAVTIHDP